MAETAKKDLRKIMLARREGLAPELCSGWDAAIESILLDLPSWRAASTVLGYCSMPQEVCTAGILQAALSQGKRLFLPRCRMGEPLFDAIEISDMVAQMADGSFLGLREPLAELPPAGAGFVPDLILVPGVAFDRFGMRLGFGAGMYDRFLSNLSGKTETIGLAYCAQMCEDAIPVSAYDVGMGAILTEQGLIERKMS